MIGKLTGILSDKNPPEVVVDCHGVGYEVNVPMSTFYNLPATGEKVSLVTHFVVREDAQILYGFATLSEREAFRQLIKISGVGPRTALSVLSGMSVTDLAQAITTQEVGRLVKVPGIGKKTAERLLLELKGKLGADLGAPQSSATDNPSDILQALVALGYSDRDAALALKALPADIGVGLGVLVPSQVAAIVIVLFIERTLYLHRGQIRSKPFVDGIKNALERRRLVQDQEGRLGDQSAGQFDPLL